MGVASRSVERVTYDCTGKARKHAYDEKCDEKYHEGRGGMRAMGGRARRVRVYSITYADINEHKWELQEYKKWHRPSGGGPRGSARAVLCI